MRHGAPKGVAPHVLFSRLLPWRPRVAIASRLACAPDVPLFVQAIPSRYVRGCANDREVAALALVDVDGQQLLDAQSIGALPVPEWRRLSVVVSEAFIGLCPTFETHNSREWIEVLKLGARHYPGEFRRIASCFDPVMSRSRVHWFERTDRYFQKPASETLDGHLFIFDAVRELLEK